ncbi:hypothetical protein [Winogradskyella sp. 4-2091]|uniref:hypothetical protein n=1 Tax=Winogradskyella sp. 4-2091 TaxID=3381659 RepID=UPI003891FD11
MNNSLAPTYQKLIGRMWVLWYSVSNSYSIVDTDFKFLIDSYLKACSKIEFNSILSKEEPNVDIDQITNTIEQYLNNCNIPKVKDVIRTSTFNGKKQTITILYRINNKIVQINYDSELVQKTIHPAIAHYSIKETQLTDIIYDIYLEDDYLFLFEDQQLITSAPKREYHKIQGKFTMLLLCAIHDKVEDDWISTFHGSTLTDGNSSILFAGNSGKGKSTLCALLTTKGFHLLADDVSPMLYKNQDFYFNPAAISIKEGAFKILEKDIQGFDNLPIVKFNKAKGYLKYLPCEHPNKLHYPCFATILVNYKANTTTAVRKVTVKEMLETLIPDSWISPNPDYAKAFLNWLENIEILELTYSDIDSAVQEISNLFKSQYK